MRLHELHGIDPLRKTGSSRFTVGEYLKTLGWVDIGSPGSTFANVYENPKYPYVLKVFESDNCYRRFTDLVRQSNNKHFPKFYGKIFKVKDNERVLGVRVEKLTKIPRQEYTANMGFHCWMVANTEPDIHFTSNLILRDLYKYNDYMPIEEKAAAWAQKNKEFVEALNLIKAHLLDNCLLDISSKNIMKRGSTWVLSDPVSPENIS